MKRANALCDFVYGKCHELRNTAKFIDDWIVTNGSPCSLCNEEKSKCQFYREAIGEEGTSEMDNTDYVDRDVCTSPKVIRIPPPDRSRREEAGFLKKQIEILLTEEALRQESINRELEAFNNSVTDDLCAPLRKIAGLVQTLQDRYAEKLGPENVDLLECILNSACNLDKLVEALPKLSQLSSLNLKYEVVDLSQIATDTVQELRQSVPGRKAIFAIEPHLCVCGDVHLLAIVLNYLIRNAWEFTSERETAYIKFGAYGSTASPIYFVHDNGIGFDMVNLERILRPFQRLNCSADYPDNGIGLPTVQSIIKRHGGRIWADGAPDEGSTFYFTIGSCTA